jgi:hypothetical protein
LTIEVTCEPVGGGWSCRVEVADGRGATSHDVAVAAADLERLEPGARDPISLVRRSFEFLLERESRESILRQFDLPVIARYFPEYERSIRV